MAKAAAAAAAARRAFRMTEDMKKLLTVDPISDLHHKSLINYSV
jgi:hypothetical protein